FRVLSLEFGFYPQVVARDSTPERREGKTMFAMMMRNPAQMLFLFTTVALAYLVLPPFFFILHTSLVTDRGLQAGTFTIQHFANIIDSLGDVKTLLFNSLVYSFGSSAVALV